MGRTLPVPVPCQVCGDKSYGRHYGVYCCDGCSCFFKRSIRKSIAYTCISGDSKCIIDKARRNWCPSCRLKKCLNVKMNKNAVQDERGPRKSKKSLNSQTDSTKLTSNRTRKLIRSTKPHAPKESITESPNFTEVPMTTLLTSIQQTLQTPLLRFANAENKLAIMMRIWPQLFTLYANSVDYRAISTIQQRSLENHSSAAIRQLLSFGSCLSLDTQEIHIASCLLICSSDLLAEINSITQNGLEDLYRLMLMYHDKTFYTADPLRSTKVFYYINALKNSVTQDAIVQSFFNQNNVTQIVTQACAL